MEFQEIEGKKLILLHIASGDETPYYYIGEKQRVAFIRIGNESVVADRLQLRNLVLKGTGKNYDSLAAPYRFDSGREVEGSLSASDLFIFFSKNRQQVKLLKWDGDGFLLYQKRYGAG